MKIRMNEFHNVDICDNHGSQVPTTWIDVESTQHLFVYLTMSCSAITLLHLNDVNSWIIIDEVHSFFVFSCLLPPLFFPSIFYDIFFNDNFFGEL